MRQLLFDGGSSPPFSSSRNKCAQPSCCYQPIRHMGSHRRFHMSSGCDVYQFTSPVSQGMENAVVSRYVSILLCERLCGSSYRYADFEKNNRFMFSSAERFLLNKASHGVGLFSRDYQKLMTEMEKAQYQQMMVELSKEHDCCFGAKNKYKNQPVLSHQAMAPALVLRESIQNAPYPAASEYPPRQASPHSYPSCRKIHRALSGP